MRKTKPNLRCGDVVQIRGREEILASLDDRGCFEHLPFMPEMLRYCGQQFCVYKRADKTCDTITGSGGRRLTDTVHLELRCDGSAHGGCQAGCLIFWKEAWLRRVDEQDNESRSSQAESMSGMSDVEEQITGRRQSGVEDRLANGVYQSHTEAADTSSIFSCQATELLKATSPLPWWDIRQYLRDVRSRNVSVGELLKILSRAIVHRIIKVGIGYRLLVASYDKLGTICGGPPYPFRAGEIPRSSATPAAQTDLRPGERVRVRTFAEILKTLNTSSRNRGLWFDAEMVPYCGKTYRVERRVQNIINERTGEMIQFTNPCIVLEGVCCRSQYSPGRLCCPRSIPAYWREIWLERVS